MELKLPSTDVHPVKPFNSYPFTATTEKPLGWPSPEHRPSRQVNQNMRRMNASVNATVLGGESMLLGKALSLRRLPERESCRRTSAGVGQSIDQVRKRSTGYHGVKLETRPSLGPLVKPVNSLCVRSRRSMNRTARPPKPRTGWLRRISGESRPTMTARYVDYASAYG